MKENKKLFTLFKDMLFISSFTFGGGFTIVSLMKNKFVDERKWLNDNEMLDIILIAESSPGAIAVNASILVGYKIFKLKGIIISVLGMIIPPITIILIISCFYNAFINNIYIKYLLDGIKVGVAAVIINSSLNLGKVFVENKEMKSIILFVIALFLITVLKINVIYIILGSILLGIMELFLFKNEVIKK